VLSGWEVTHIQHATIEPPPSPTAAQVFCSQPGKSRTATTEARPGSQVPGLSQSPVCSTHLFYPDMPLPALRMRLRPRCRQGTRPGWLYSSWTLYPTTWNHARMGHWRLGVHMESQFFFFPPELPLISKPKLDGALPAHANLPPPRPDPAIWPGNSVQPTNGCQHQGTQDPLPAHLQQRRKIPPHPGAAPLVCSICRTHHPRQREFNKIKQLA